MAGKTKTRAKRKKGKSAKTFSVYVIELKKEVLSVPKFVKANPDHDPDKACFYVGMTGHTPRKRFNQHKANYKANRYARDHGLWLRKRKYQSYNPMTFDDAVEKEKELAENLRAKGHAVWQK